MAADAMPDHKIKYAMGLGRPEEIVRLVNMGYSLFDTNGTSYKSSRLMHDEAIEHQLHKWGITKDFLLSIREVLEAHLSETLIAKYKGYFGVDMFVYEDSGCYKVNPVVEINFRMTMGLVAAVLRAKLLATDLQSMYMHYEAETEKLIEMHNYYKHKYCRRERLKFHHSHRWFLNPYHRLLVQR